MRANHRPIRNLLAAPALFASISLAPLRQEPTEHSHDVPPLRIGGQTGSETAPDGKEDPHQEMKRLFGKIERELREIDRLLSEASAGPRGAKGTKAPSESPDAAAESTSDDAVTDASKKASDAVSGMSELLKKSEDSGKTVLAEIDRILELAEHPHESQSSCSSAGGLCRSSSPSKQGSQPGQQPGAQQGEQPGQSPLDQHGEGQTQRESTPSAPQKQPGSEGEQKEESKSDQGQPQGDQASKLPSQNRLGAPPPKGASDPASRGANAVDKWGELPVHARDVFRAQGGGDMPAQYRDWIDAYYRRLAKRSGS